MILVSSLDAVACTLDHKDIVACCGLLSGYEVLGKSLDGGQIDVSLLRSREYRVSGRYGGIFGVAVLINGNEFLAYHVYPACAVVCCVNSVNSVYYLSDEQSCELTLACRKCG